MRGPIPVRLITALGLISVGGAVLITAITIVAAAIEPGRGLLPAFLRGALETLGYSHDSFGAYEAGEVFGVTSLGVLPPLTILYAVRTRRLWLLRSAAVIWIFVAAGLGGWTLLPWIVVVSSFLPPVRRFFREEFEGVLGDLEADKAA